MFVTSQLIMLTLLTFSLGFAPQPLAQACKVSTDFQGQWQWAVYAKSKEELPPALQDMGLEEVPRHSLALDIEQRRQKLNGRYAATAQFVAKIEDGSFTTSVKTKAVQLDLESAFGGKVTAKLTLQGNKLHWKLIMAEGEHYFPDKVFLEKRRVASVGLADFFLCQSDAGRILLFLRGG